MHKSHDFGYQPLLTGAFYLRDQRYRPVGKLGNVYKCCKILRDTFQKYNLDSQLPDRHLRSRFLEGELELDSVAEHKRRHSGARETPQHKPVCALQNVGSKDQTKQNTSHSTRPKTNLWYTQHGLLSLRYYPF